MILRSISLLVFCGFLPLTALAEDPVGTISAGAKLGLILVDSSAVDGLKDATGWNVDLDFDTGFGLHVDYKINQNWYVDAEYISGKAEVNFWVDGITGSGDVDLSSFAVYGAYRTEGQFYWVGKLGLIRQAARADGFKDSSTGISLGVGAGYRLHEKVSVEGELTSIDKDAAFLGLTGRYHF